MNKTRLTEHDLMALAEQIGLALGSILPVLAQFPPETPEKAVGTSKALKEAFTRLFAHGTPPNAAVFLDALEKGINHYATGGHRH